MGDFPPPPGSTPPPPGGGQPPPGGYPPPGGGAPPGGYPPPGGGAPPGGYPPPGGGAPPSDAGWPGQAPGPFGQPAPGYGYPGYGTTPRAGFWTRFAAFVIDGIIVTLFGVPAYIALVTGPTKIEACSLDSSGDIDFDGTVKNGLCEVPNGTTWAIFAGLLILAVVGAIVYFAKLEGGSGQTVGSRALGIKVVDTATGQPIGTGRAVGRYFARIVSSIPCYLGYFWMLWDPDKQTWHDKLVNSVVVRA